MREVITWTATAIAAYLVIGVALALNFVVWSYRRPVKWERAQPYVPDCAQSRGGMAIDLIVLWLPIIVMMGPCAFGRLFDLEEGEGPY